MKIDGNSNADIKGFSYNPDYAWKEWAEMFKSHIAKELFWYVCDPPANGSESGITVFDGLKMEDYIQTHKGIWEGNVSTAHPCYNTISFTQIADKMVIDEQGNERHLMLSPNARQNSWLWENAIREGDWQYLDIPIHDLEENYTEDEQREYDNRNEDLKRRIKHEEGFLEDLKVELDEARNAYNEISGVIEELIENNSQPFDQDWIGDGYETYPEPQGRIQTSYLFWQLKNARLYVDTGEISISDHYTYIKEGGEYIDPTQDYRDALEDYNQFKNEQWVELVTYVPDYNEAKGILERIQERVSYYEEQLKLLKASLTPTREISHWRLWNTFFGQWNAKNKNEQPVMDWKFTREDMPMWAFNQMFKDNFSQDTSVIDISSAIQSSIPNDMWVVSSIPYRYIPKETTDNVFLDSFVAKVNDFFQLGKYYPYGAEEIVVSPDLLKKPQAIEDELIDRFKETGIEHYDHILASGMGIRELGWVDFLYPSQAYGGVYDWNHYAWLYPLTAWGEPKPPVQVLYTNQLVLGNLLWLNYRNWMNTAVKVDSMFKTCGSRIATLEMNYPIVHRYQCDKSKHVMFGLHISSHFPEGKTKEDFVTPEQLAMHDDIFYYSYDVNVSGYAKPEGVAEPEPDKEFVAYNQMIDARDYTPQKIGHVDPAIPLNGDVLTIGNYLGKVGIYVTLDQETGGLVVTQDDSVYAPDDQMQEAWGKISTIMSLQSPEDKMKEKIEELERRIADCEYERDLYQNRRDNKWMLQQEWQHRMEELARTIQLLRDEYYDRQYGIGDQDYDLFCMNFLERMYPELIGEIRELLQQIDYAKEHVGERFDELKREAMKDYLWTPAYDYINQNYGFTSTFDDPEMKMYDVEGQFFVDASISEQDKMAYQSYKQWLESSVPSDQDIMERANKEVEILEKLLEGYVWRNERYEYDPSTSGARYQELKRQYLQELQKIFTHCDSILVRLKKEIDEMTKAFSDAHTYVDTLANDIDEIEGKIGELEDQIEAYRRQIDELKKSHFTQDLLPRDFFVSELFTEIEQGQAEHDFTSDSWCQVGYNLRYVYPTHFGTSYRDLKDAGVEQQVLNEVGILKKWIVDSDFPSKVFNGCHHLQDNWLWKKYALERDFERQGEQEEESR